MEMILHRKDVFPKNLKLTIYFILLVLIQETNSSDPKNFDGNLSDIGTSQILGYSDKFPSKSCPKKFNDFLSDVR